MKFELATLTAAAIASTAAAGGVVEITKENFKAQTQGKNAFVKFFTPWCAGCKLMAEDWHNLGSSYADKSVVIGEVDCSSRGEEWCNDFSVDSFPTLKYFVDGDEHGEDYQGRRDLTGLMEFAEADLEVKCHLSDTSWCSEEEVKYMEEMKAKSEGERAAETKRLVGMMGDSMNEESKEWMGQRLRILEQFRDGIVDEVKCYLSDTSSCSEKEVKFTEKMKAKSDGERGTQYKRLASMMGNPMKEELKVWVVQRLRILQQLKDETVKQKQHYQKGQNNNPNSFNYEI